MPEPKTSLNELLHEIRRIEKHRTILTEEKIKKIYQSLSKDLNTFLADYYVKYADNEGILTVSKLQEKMKFAKFLEEIEENVNFISPKVRKEINSLVDKTYKACYEGMSNAVSKADDVKELIKVKDFTPRPEVIKQAVENNITKLTLNNVLEKHRQEIVYNIKQTLVTGLLTGERYNTMANKLMDKVDFSYGKSIRVARTESHRNVEAGFNDCALEISNGLKNSDVVYTKTWHTMGDERVRPQVRYKTKKGWKTKISKNGANHIKMEGQIQLVDEPFIFSDGSKGMFPGDITLPASQACNCRCTLEHKFMKREKFEELKKQNQ